MSSALNLPGIDLPIDWKPARERGVPYKLFPNALDLSDIKRGDVEYIFTKRELVMLQIMESITDKPEWDRKVFDEAITAKWRHEITYSGEDVTPKMVDWMIDELRWKAEQYRKTGILESYDPGVVKSDTAIPEDLREALKQAVVPLEDVPESEKDYHPWSQDQVVNLVHPSLFPLIYGRTWVLRDRTIGLDDCLDSIGEGYQTEVQTLEEPVPKKSYYRKEPNPYSLKFQWLPCEVKLDSEGGCEIASYINNLHPIKHRGIYDVIARVLEKVIPLWEVTLGHRENSRRRRIPYWKVEYLPTDEPEPERRHRKERQEEESEEEEEKEEEEEEEESEEEEEKEEEEEEEGEDEEESNHSESESSEGSRDFRWRYEDWQDSRVLRLPEPGEFEPPREMETSETSRIRADLIEKGLQVIVKLANIELTPENPVYQGGSWHVEGQLNERICATAIYYYDSENVTQNELAFRHRLDGMYFQDVSYETGKYGFLEDVFGVDDGLAGNTDGEATQDLGAVSSRQGRLLTFPNTLQHCVSPFSLDDKTKPGHRKILAFFLIDPNRRVLSTANVPPQREDWCKGGKDIVEQTLGDRLPLELQEMVRQNLDFQPITMDDAKQYRLDLMMERSARNREISARFEQACFSLCEH